MALSDEDKLEIRTLIGTELMLYTIEIKKELKNSHYPVEMQNQLRAIYQIVENISRKRLSDLTTSRK